MIALKVYLKIFDASFLVQLVDFNEFWWIPMMLQPLIGFLIIHIPSTNHFPPFNHKQKSRRKYCFLSESRPSEQCLSIAIENLFFCSNNNLCLTSIRNAIDIDFNQISHTANCDREQRTLVISSYSYCYQFSCSLCFCFRILLDW